ncbi:MAG: aspartate dehydrogenase [Gemmobacter sp.]|nr:aspartate dehydrogenase [Gemmobacter sp.]
MSGCRVVLVGWGAIGQRVADLLVARAMPGAAIVGVAVRNARAVQNLPNGAKVIVDPDMLAGLKPDLVVEVAGRAAVAPWGRAALAAGADFAPASTSAFSDPLLLNDLVALARAHQRQVLIPPGALGGIDALSAASRLGLDTVRHEIIKPPAAWRGTEAETLCDLNTLSEATTFFEGTADQAAVRFPQNANVAMISALAGIGSARTTVALVADPAAQRNAHRLFAVGDFGTLAITLENRPIPTNPKTSELTALSLVRLIENRVSPLVI